MAGGKIYELTLDLRDLGELEYQSKGDFLAGEFAKGNPTTVIAAGVYDLVSNPAIEYTYNDFIRGIEACLRPETWTSGLQDWTVIKIALMILEYEDGDEEPGIQYEYTYEKDLEWSLQTEEVTETVVWTISNAQSIMSDIWQKTSAHVSTAWTGTQMIPDQRYTGQIMAMKKFLISEVLGSMMTSKQVVEGLFTNSVLVWGSLSEAASDSYSFSKSKVRVSERVQQKIRAMGLLSGSLDKPSDSEPRELKLTPMQFHRIRTVPFSSDPKDYSLGWTDRIIMSNAEYDQIAARPHVVDAGADSMGMSKEFSDAVLPNASVWLKGKPPDSKEGPLRFINVPTVTLPTDYLDVALGGDSTRSEPIKQHEDLIRFLWKLNEYDFVGSNGDYTQYDYGTSEIDILTWTQWWSEWPFITALFGLADNGMTLDQAHKVLYGRFILNLLAYDREKGNNTWEKSVNDIFWEAYDSALPVKLKSNGIDTSADAGANSYVDSILILVLNNEEIERRIARWEYIVNAANDHPTDLATGDLDGDGDIDLTDVALREGFAEGVSDAEIGAFAAGLPPVEVLTAEDIEDRQKFFKQCALMINAHRLKHQLRTRHYREFVKSKDSQWKPFDGRFWMGSCESDQERLINNLISSEDGKEFFNIPPAILSYLTPKMRFYKVENDGQGVLTDTEFVFGQHTDLDRAKHYTRTKTGQKSRVSIPTSYLASDFDKGDGCGVKEFSFQFEGATPATSRNDIKAKLVLYFQTFADMLRERVSYNGRVYRFVDLIIQPKPDDLERVNNIEIVHPNQYDPSFYRIRAEVGYNPIGADVPIDFKGYKKEQWEKLNQAILRTNRAYYLCMVDHDLDIKNDGTVVVTISYQAYVETAMKSLRFDALTTPALVEARKKSQENLQKMLDNPKCTDAMISQYQFLVSTGEDSIRAESLRSILSRLLYRDRIYGLTIDKEDARMFRRNGFFKSCRLKSLYGDTIPDDFESADMLKSVDPDTAGMALEDILEDGRYPENFNFADVDDLTINFFYFGDLLHTILDSMYDKDGQIVTTMENTKFLLGSLDFNTFIQRNNKTPVDPTINIAELPISVDYFMQWFTENVLEQGETRKSFPIIYFVRNLANQLLKNSLLENCVHRKLETKTRFQTGQITAFSPDGRDPFGKLVSRKGWTVNTDQMRKGGFLPMLGDADQELRTAAGVGGLSPYYHNYLVVNVVGSSLTYTGLGRYKDDVETGRYHIDIGSNRGIVKTVKFSKTDIQYLREARFMRQGIDGLQQLANVYKANIEMYGNSLFYPGMELYINPYGIGGTAFGSPVQGPRSKGGRSLANTLGVGGYHTITSVNSSIKPGSYTTSITAQWYYSGDGEGNPANSGTRLASSLKDIEEDRNIWDADDTGRCEEIYLQQANVMQNLLDNPEDFMTTATSNIENIPPSLLEASPGGAEGDPPETGSDITVISGPDDPSVTHTLQFVDDDENEYSVPYSTIVENTTNNSEEFWHDGNKNAVLTKGVDGEGNSFVKLELFIDPYNGKTVVSTEFSVTELPPGERADDREGTVWREDKAKNVLTRETDPDPHGGGESPVSTDDTGGGGGDTTGDGVDPVVDMDELSWRERLKQEREERRAARNEVPEEEGDPDQQPMSDLAIREEEITEKMFVQIDGYGVTDVFQSNSVFFFVDNPSTGKFEYLEVYGPLAWEQKQKGLTGGQPYQRISMKDVRDRPEVILAAHQELSNKGNNRLHLLAKEVGVGTYAENTYSTAGWPALPRTGVLINPVSTGLGELGKDMAHDLNAWYSHEVKTWEMKTEDDQGRWKDFPYYIFKIDPTKTGGQKIQYGTDTSEYIKETSWVAIRRGAVGSSFDPEGSHSNYKQFELKKPTAQELNRGWYLGDIPKFQPYGRIEFFMEI